MKSKRLFGVVAVGGLFAIGCGDDGRVKPQTIEIKEDTPLKRATTLLESYAKGQPLGSEVESYPQLVSDLRAQDPARGEVLEKGLEELQKTKGAATTAKAKELLKKLAPQMTG